MRRDRAPHPGTPRVAVQGDPGCFSHAAAMDAFDAIELVPCSDFPALFEVVESGGAEWGVVPVENALAGAVSETLDLLLRSDLVAMAETYVRVELCLTVRVGSGAPEAAIDGLTAAASHPVALRQCRRFFAEHPHIRPIVAEDTAGSIRALIEGSPGWDAAIGPALAAELYGARILRRGIEDDPLNFTRFLVVGPPGSDASAGGPRSGREGDATLTGRTKASLIFTLPHRPGSLHRAIGLFAELGLDLTRLESRPIMGRPWEYTFHADVRGDEATALRRGVDALRRLAPKVREIGIYPEVRIPQG